MSIKIMSMITTIEPHDKEALYKAFPGLKEYSEKFPTEESKKELIIKNLNEILEALGSYLNDPDFKITYENDTVTLQSVYGTKCVYTEGTSASCFFGDVLNLYLKNIKELEFIEIDTSKK